MNAELTYSDEALRNRTIFIKNDINIFVEDVGKEYLYEEIFNRLFKGKYKINAIFPLGGKGNVLKEYIRNGERDSDGNLNIYLLDGDFDRYIGYPEVVRDDFSDDIDNESELNSFIKNVIVKSDSVIYLDTYNIESFILEGKPVIKHVQGKVQETETVVSNTVCFDNWKERVVGESKELFLLYSFINKYLFLYGSMFNGEKSKLSIPTVNKTSFLFLDNKTGFKKSENVITDFKNKILLALEEENPELDLDSEIDIINSRYKEINGENYFNLICGKFLFNSLSGHLSNVCNKKFDLEMLKWDLVRNFDINKLNFLSDRIEELI